MSEENAPRFDPIGTGQKNGIIFNPIGTYDEIMASGYNPETVACCAAERKRDGVRGCPVEGRCPFTREGVGDYRGESSTNFKGQGPKMLGYYIRTANSEGAREAENEITCYGFVRTLLARMRKGRADADEGKDHELIRVIAMEGETIVKKEIAPMNPEGSRTGKDIREKVLPPKLEPVSHFPRPGDNVAVTHAKLMRDREAERKKALEYNPPPREEQIRKMSEKIETEAKAGVSAAPVGKVRK